MLFCSAKVGGEVFGIPRGKFFHGHVAFEIGDYAVDNGQFLLNLLKIRAAAVGAFFGNSFAGLEHLGGLGTVVSSECRDLAESVKGYVKAGFVFFAVVFRHTKQTRRCVFKPFGGAVEILFAQGVKCRFVKIGYCFAAAFLVFGRKKRRPKLGGVLLCFYGGCGDIGLLWSGRFFGGSFDLLGRSLLGSLLFLCFLKFSLNGLLCRFGFVLFGGIAVGQGARDS